MSGSELPVFPVSGGGPVLPLTQFRLSGLLLVAAVFLGACSVTATPRADNDDPVLEVGRTVYIRNCASCHGAAGGGGKGPPLSEGRIGANFANIEDQIDLVTNGKGGMPAFSGRLTEEELEAVVRFTREVL